MARIAVVLTNLGGPDGPAAVRPFLQNLFADPLIIRLPGFIRLPLAWLIARRRAPLAGANYDHMGGGSPILPNSERQRAALESRLNGSGGHEWRCFLHMRYWHPMAAEAVAAVKAFAPDRIILLPLYPQYSTTTTKSSWRVWDAAAGAAGLNVPTHRICCWPRDASFIEASAALIAPALDKAAGHGAPRLLFSAHGLPQKVVDDGDPYQWQVERTAQEILTRLGRPRLDYAICYQSRVGPLKWIGPSTEDELRRAGHDRVPVVLYPLAFVSEHVETLVELDIEYRELALEANVPAYERVETVSADETFISGLAELARGALEAAPGLNPPAGRRLCPREFGECACAGGRV